MLCHIGTRQALGENLSTSQGVALALREFLAAGDLESDRLTSDGLHQRSALLAREHRRVDLLLQIFGGQNETGTRPGQRLVNGRGDDVGVRHRIRVQPCGHQSGEVRHIDPELRSHFVSNRTEGLEIELARVSGPAGHDDVGALGDGLLAHLVHVNAVRLGVHLISSDAEILARVVQLHAVGQVATMSQGQPH